jgi:hypothetical protein
MCFIKNLFSFIQEAAESLAQISFSQVDAIVTLEYSSELNKLLMNLKMVQNLTQLPLESICQRKIFSQLYKAFPLKIIKGSLFVSLYSSDQMEAL